MINFPRRRDLIREAQTLIGFTNSGVDGIDGPKTWSRIVGVVASPFHNLNIPRSGYVDFPGRRGVVSAVQRSLNIPSDSRDGPQTWGAIIDALDPKSNLEIPPPIANAYTETIRGRTPNRNAGKNTCEGIILHHCAGTFEGSISWILKPRTYAAYHCLVHPNGSRAILAKDEDRVHHAGVSEWRGRRSCNNFMLALSVTGSTVSGARRESKDLSQHEVLSSAQWIREKLNRYSLDISDVTTHAAVSPRRKDDISKNAAAQILEELRQ